MTNKHTPGPWEVRPSSNPRNGSAWRDIVSMGQEFSCSYVGEALEQDAALIASAPALLAERDKLLAVNAELLAALDRLIFAAECRDNTMGDQSRLIDVKAALVAATVLARSASFEAKNARAEDVKP
jgi:hypothetical protein